MNGRNEMKKMQAASGSSSHEGILMDEVIDMAHCLRQEQLLIASERNCKCLWGFLELE